MPIRRARPAPDFLLLLMLGAALVFSGAAFAQEPDPEPESAGGRDSAAGR